MPPRNPLATTAQFIESAPQDPTANIDGELGMGDVYNAYGSYSVGGNDQNLYNSLAQRSNNFQLSGDPQIAANIAAKNRAATAMPDLSYGDMFPSANNNINKGSYSGSIVGNVPVFAPSHLTPFGAFDKRDAALKNAAALRAQEQIDFNKTKAPTTKLFAVQGQLDEQFSKGLDQWTNNAKKQYGENWVSALKQDPNFNNWMQSMSTVAQYHTGISDTMGEIDAQMKDGTFVASPELRKIMGDTKSGIANLQNVFDPKGHQVGTNLLKMRAVYDLDKATNNALDEVVKSVVDSNYGISSQGIYDILTNTTTTGVDDSRIAKLAESVYLSKYSDGSGFTKEQVYDALKAKLGEKVKTHDIKTQTNQFSSSGGADLKYDEGSINPEGVPVTYGATENGVTTYDGQTFQKPIALNVPNQTNVIDPLTGKRIDVPANSKVVIGKTFNILITKDGAPVAGNEVPSGQNPKDYHYETYAAGTVKQGTARVSGIDDEGNPTSDTDVKERTLWIPVEGIKGGIMTVDANGKYVKGGRLDYQKTAAEKKTAELHKRGAASTGAVSDPSEADYNALPKGAKYTYQGVEYIKE